MNELNETEFRIVIDKQPKRVWSFGICISHFYDETYIYLNLFKISISIGNYLHFGEMIGVSGNNDKSRSNY